MTDQDSKSSPEKGQSQARAKLPKTHLKYWEGAVSKRTYEWNGEPVEIPEWQIRLAHGGKQKWFNTGTTNKAKAGPKAKEIYDCLKANGWKATEALYSPKKVAMEPAVNAATVGGYLDLVETKTTLNPVTFGIYRRKLGTALAGMFGISGGKEKYNYRTGGRAEWLDKIRRIRLDEITNDRIDAWRVKSIKAAQSQGGDAEESAKRTISSLIRAGKALFRADLAAQVGATLPNPAPFVTARNVEHVTLPKYESNKQVPFNVLDVAAERELRDSQEPIDREAYKAFVLSLWAGLRRREIDDLVWDAFDWNGNTVSVNSDRLKSDGSQRTVDLDPALVLWFRDGKAESKSAFVISSSRKAKHEAKYYRYRAEKVFERMLAWLRSKGIDTNKPLHTLRKEFGSICIDQYDIYTAQQQLGHAKIETTVASYAEKRGHKPLIRRQLIPPTLEQQAAN